MLESWQPLQGVGASKFKLPDAQLTSLGSIIRAEIASPRELDSPFHLIINSHVYAGTTGGEETENILYIFNFPRLSLWLTNQEVSRDTRSLLQETPGQMAAKIDNIDSVVYLT